MLTNLQISNIFDFGQNTDKTYIYTNIIGYSTNLIFNSSKYYTNITLVRNNYVIFNVNCKIYI